MMEELELVERKGVSFYIKRTFGILLLLSMAAVFFYSAYAKSQSLEVFEWTFMDMGIRSYSFAVILARLFIALEYAIGGLLLAHIYLKRFTYPLTIAVLGIFILYLVILIIQKGDTGNCQCFGEEVLMTPSQAIIKNVIMIGVTVLLMYIYPIKPYKGQMYVGSLVVMGALVVAIVTYPLNIGNKPQPLGQPLELSLLYKDTVSVPKTELREGKHIICFMSLTCPHCRKAARFFRILKEQHPEYPVYFVLVGHEDHLNEFYQETEATNVPYFHLKQRGVLPELGITSVPSIFWVNDGVAEYKGNYLQLDPVVIDKWLKE